MNSILQRRLKLIKYIEPLAILFLILTAIILIGAQLKPLGWYVWLIGILILTACSLKFRSEIVLIYLAVAALGLSPISTSLSTSHAFAGGFFVFFTLALPYLISKYIYHDQAVRFQWNHGRRWHSLELTYILFTALISYLLMPVIMRTSGSYLNWTLGSSPDSLIRLFIGCVALGVWDELFFICTVLGILRRHLEFPLANLVQAFIFTSFLYALGFRGTAAVAIFCFALIQGYIFQRTESLFYVITIHLVADAFLFLTLINLYHPNWVPIFITL